VVFVGLRGLRFLGDGVLLLLLLLVDGLVGLSLRWVMRLVWGGLGVPVLVCDRLGGRFRRQPSGFVPAVF